jgi:hypothetical protein
MSTLPVMWNSGVDQLPVTCPYSFAEVEEYFFGRLHDLLFVKEPRKFFRVSGPCPCAQKFDADRRYWMFEAIDCELPRQWFVVVGAGGKSPHKSYKTMKRWMYAETNDDGLSPAAFVYRVHHEQLEAEAGS